MKMWLMRFDGMRALNNYFVAMKNCCEESAFRESSTLGLCSNYCLAAYSTTIYTGR